MSTSVSSALKQLGRPMTYYPALARIIGLKESIFLCQLVYWTPRAHNDDGWIYKSVEEMESETGLSYKEQIRLRKALVDKQLISENYSRNDHRLFFKVNADELDKLGEHLTNGHMLHVTKSKGASDQKSDGICPKVSSIKSSSTEITAEITQKNLTASQNSAVSESFALSSDDEEPKKRAKKAVDARHQPFREMLEKFYKFCTKKELYWTPADAKQLANYLKQNPEMTASDLRIILNNFMNSENVNCSAYPRQFLGRLNLYAAGPLDKFGKPITDDERTVH